jgi:hypothetical protein
MCVSDFVPPVFTHLQCPATINLQSPAMFDWQTKMEILMSAQNICFGLHWVYSNLLSRSGGTTGRSPSTVSRAWICFVPCSIHVVWIMARKSEGGTSIRAGAAGSFVPRFSFSVECFMRLLNLRCLHVQYFFKRLISDATWGDHFCSKDVGF